MCMFGKVDTGHSNAIDMTLGLPQRTLHRMGIRTAIDEDFVLTIHVGGTAQSPEIDMMQCAPLPMN